MNLQFIAYFSIDHFVHLVKTSLLNFLYFGISYLLKFWLLSVRCDPCVFFLSGHCCCMCKSLRTVGSNKSRLLRLRHCKQKIFLDGAQLMLITSTHQGTFQICMWKKSLKGAQKNLNRTKAWSFLFPACCWPMVARYHLPLCNSKRHHFQLLRFFHWKHSLGWPWKPAEWRLEQLPAPILNLPRDDRKLAVQSKNWRVCLLLFLLHLNGVPHLAHQQEESGPRVAKLRFLRKRKLVRWSDGVTTFDLVLFRGLCIVTFWSAGASRLEKLDGRFCGFFIRK